MHGLSLASDSWVGRLDDAMLITVGAEHFLVEDTTTVDAVEELLGLVSARSDPAAITYEDLSRRGLGDTAAALVETGLLLDTRVAPPSVDREPFAAALVAALRRNGVSASGVAEARADSEPAVLLHVSVDGDDHTTMREAVRLGISRRIPLIMVAMEWGGVSVSPLIAPGGHGCGYCLRSRHLATLPAGVGRIRGPGHRLVARRLPPRPPATAIDRLAATMAEVVLDRSEQAVRISMDGSEVVRHNLLPVPTCRACGPWSGAEARAAGDLPFRRTLDRAVDSWCGLVTTVVTGAETFGLQTVLADGVLPLDGAGVPQERIADRARGVAATPEAARSLAIAEALERHCARTPWLAGVRTDPTAGEVRFNLAELWPYADTQLTEGTSRVDVLPERWVRAEGLDAAPVWLPEAAMVIGPPRQGLRPAQVTSNGFAAGPTTGFARGRAIAELIERDAVMTTWFHRRPARPLEVARLGNWAEHAAENLLETGVRVTLWLLAAAIEVPVVLAVGRADNQAHPTLSLGAACAPDIPQAAARALRELASNVAATAAEILAGSLPPIAEAAVVTIDDHAAYYRNPQAADALDFLDRGLPPVSGGQLECGFDIEQECLSAGLRVASLDITPPDVALCGLRVTRALSPDLVPIWFGWHREPLAHPRLRSVAPNRAPHPFR